MGATSTNFFQNVIFSSKKVDKIGKNWQKLIFFDVLFFTVFVLRMSMMCSTT
jgi:hypothetical protein